jgi:hypothetical protein
MEKQTATEWMFKQLWEEPKDKFTWNAILMKANEMFEQQIIDAYAQGFIESEVMDKGAEQYYNQKYKQD